MAQLRLARLIRPLAGPSLKTASRACPAATPGPMSLAGRLARSPTGAVVQWC